MNALENRHRRRLLLYAVLWLLIMIVIFCMSAEDGEKSGEMSSMFLVTWFGKLLKALLPSSVSDNAEYLVRKMAHMFEYFCLGCSSCLLAYEVLLNRKSRLGKAVAFAFVWGFLYACSDEWHQTFVSERAGLFTDVLIDSIGTLCALLLFTCVHLLAKREKKTKLL